MIPTTFAWFQKLKLQHFLFLIWVFLLLVVIPGSIVNKLAFWRSQWKIQDFLGQCHDRSWAWWGHRYLHGTFTRNVLPSSINVKDYHLHRVFHSTPHSVDVFTSFKILFFSFKNCNVKVKVGIVVPVNNSTVSNKVNHKTKLLKLYKQKLLRKLFHNQCWLKS